MSIIPDKIYTDRKDVSIRPSWRANWAYINDKHRTIFEETKDIPGWQMEGDSYKLFEMGYFAGQDILEIGTFSGRSAVIELEGALSNDQRKEGPRFFGIDIEMESIKRTYNTLLNHGHLLEYALLFHGDLRAFFSKFPIGATMVFLDGDHRYEMVKKDLEVLGDMLGPGIPVLFHDFLNPENETGSYGVRRAATEWEEAGFAAFYGAFGCSGLFVTQSKCKGAGKAVMGRQAFVKSKDELLESYGLTKQRVRTFLANRLHIAKPDGPAVRKVDADPTAILERLTSFPKKDGMIFFSDSRSFAHDEASYDTQYNISASDFLPGQGLVSALRARRADFSLPALEIGCGSGVLSLGLVKENAYPCVFLTDPSVAFLRIVRDKLQKNKLDTDSVFLGVLKAEEICRLPENAFSLIAMRSTLHHVLDVPRLIRDASKLLAPMGFLTYEEPCLEGYMLMAAMAQFLPLVLEKARIHLTQKQEEEVRIFVESIKYCARRDLDKKAAEDKHLFRVDEMMTVCATAGLSVEFLPNITYERCLESGPLAERRFSFHNFFRDYLKYCMGFDNQLICYMDEHLKPFNGFIEEICAGDNAPYCYSVFLCQKR